MAENTKDQQRKTAIITGSSRGIGKGIAFRLAKDGFDICINDIEANAQGIDQVVQELTTLGRKAIGIVADVSRRQEVESLVDKSVNALGPLSVMIANAGITQVKGCLEITEQDMERVFGVNVFGVFNCYQIAAKQFIKQGSKGKLIGAASVPLLLRRKEGVAKGDTLKKYSANILMGRVSVPDDVAKTVSFLASEDTHYMTGQTLIIDGGIAFS